MNSPAITRLNAALEGRYRIERELGEGGMAAVYLAEDLKHERKVALKVLKPELAAVIGAERFLAEIKTTANLQHPHILPLHDSGEAEGMLFYVMPYVEGETLRDRLDREHQLPVDDAVRIATNMAEALDYAHRQGVIHRDIKPANVLLQDGKPVISDFGIALAVSAGGGGRLTETGLSLGTPHYMSPEQATGDAHLSAATDIYGLGAVLHEMVAGEPPHTGSTAQAILGKIISGERVSLLDHRSTVPSNVDAAVRRALEKLPADRFSSCDDFARALSDPGFTHGGDHPAAGSSSWNRITLVSTAVAVVALLGLSWVLMTSDGAASSGGAVARFTVSVGEEEDVFLGGVLDTQYGYPAATALAISPDGQTIVYSAWERLEDGPARSRLYRRRLAQERADALPGTEGASGPVFSPDGESVAFFTVDGYKAISLENGDVQTIGAVAGSFPRSARRTATWGDDGTFVASYGESLYTSQVPSAGGMDPLLQADTVLPGAGFSQPHMLPGSRKLLLTVRPWSVDPELAGVHVLDLETLERTLVVENAMSPMYMEPGYLLFTRQGALLAAEFDADAGELRGEPRTVIEDVMQAVGMPNSDNETGVTQVSLSGAGALVYASGGIFPGQRRLALRIAPDGTPDRLDLPVEDYAGGRVSPDGDRLAFTVYEGRSSTIVIHDLRRRVTERLDGGGFEVAQPEWSPDGSEIAYQSDHEDGVKNIYRIAADGSGTPERVAPANFYQAMLDWSSTGVIAYQQDGDVWVVPPGEEPQPLLQSEHRHSHATFSPDGRWIAYVYNGEVYVRPYPGPDAPIRISDDGGNAPMWSWDGRRIFFRRGPITERVLLAAELQIDGGDLRASRPAVMIPNWSYQGYTPMRSPDVFSDGSFLAIAYQDAFEDPDNFSPRTADRFRVENFHVVLNFAEELSPEFGRQ